MKVLDLRCRNGHGFEGWFGSEDEFLDQNGRGLVACPLCADKVVTRMPSAPRLNLSGARLAPQAVASPEAAPEPDTAMQDQFLRALRHVLENTDDVGPRFAEEARRIHYGEVPTRGIRGQATPAERESLADEGIEVASLPLPEALKGPLQ